MTNKVSGLLLLISIVCCSDKKEMTVPSYVLPYAVGETYELIQGNGGSFSHTGKFHYSFDFSLPIGSTITASREGTVVDTEESFTDGNRTPGLENYVIIQHADGTYGRYFHLTKDGALVSTGAVVTKGQPIGLSGDTGFSSLPHLHFDVTTECALPAPNCQTVSIQFENAVDRVPVSGKGYEAL